MTIDWDRMLRAFLFIYLFGIVVFLIKIVRKNR